MFYLIGKNALTNFERTRLSQKTKEIINQDVLVTAQYFYLINNNFKLSNSELDRLCLLLDADVELDKDYSIRHYDFVVIPRMGTISPWSSKVGELLVHCGVTEVQRVERGIVYSCDTSGDISKDSFEKLSSVFYDRMTQSIVTSLDDALAIFNKPRKKQLQYINILQDSNALEKANQSQGLSLSLQEIYYLNNSFKDINRNPTDAEIFAYSQINSEHCRHKVFNAKWVIDNDKKNNSLFSMIKNTSIASNDGIISAYKDNGAVIKSYSDVVGNKNIVIKVETHNHPTAISPFAGAATGVGGEIRDEAATGRGAQSIAGISGFCVSNLNIPGYSMPWEEDTILSDFIPPRNIATPLEIIIDGPVGAASFSNEFGRPQLCGYFRTFQQKFSELDFCYGYHKPIMIAGGMGIVENKNSLKEQVNPNTSVIAVLGGPGYLIGLGGGSLSSKASNSEDNNLDFASTQRSNPEMQRRAQEVINICSKNQNNPIISIHDLGAGGLSNALSEILHENNIGAELDLLDIPVADHSMSPLEVLANESQERYVIAVDKDNLDIFTNAAKRENCPYSILGELTATSNLQINNRAENNIPFNVPLNLLFDNTPKLTKSVYSSNYFLPEFETKSITIADAITRLLQLPTISSKKFLITINDRSVGGLVARDQMVGPYQVPVANCAVTMQNYHSHIGQAMSIGERPIVSILDAKASVRLAVGEAITNIVGSPIKNISDIKLSANWMVAQKDDKEAIDLFNAVEELGLNFCPKLGIAIPVGKDSTSMQLHWKDKTVKSPLSCVISAFAPVTDVRENITPLLVNDTDTSLLFIDLAKGKNRIAASCLSQIYNSIGKEPADVDDPEIIKSFFRVFKSLKSNNKILSYHDRSDGGLLITLLEMAFTSKMGLSIDISMSSSDIEYLFNEELGCVVQVKNTDVDIVTKELESTNLISCYKIAVINDNKDITIIKNNSTLYIERLEKLEKLWSTPSYKIQELRDNPESAVDEFTNTVEDALSLDNSKLPSNFDWSFDEFNVLKSKPKIAILREQGTNGHLEMLSAFAQAGFDSIDVHINDILNKNITIKEFSGMAICGGFSYGDVLGAGLGFAAKILFDQYLNDQFKDFFNDKNKFALGICNGCQVLSKLKSIIPGTSFWPKLLQNKSGQFESRYSLVRVEESNSLFFKGLEGAVLPIVSAHKEGRMKFKNYKEKLEIINSNTTLRFVDNNHTSTENYPANPNGTLDGITGLCNTDGRIMMLMPHPERIFRKSQFSYYPNSLKGESDYSPWFSVFTSARKWLD